MASSQQKFIHKRINLELRRNVTALADPFQHKPRLDNDCEKEDRLSLDKWIEDAIVAISPSADMILFSGQSPEKLVFLAKLRMEPMHMYTTKDLNIPMDFDENATSLLCLPIMSTKQALLGSTDWTALVVGFSSGYVKFFTEQSICLLSFKFCDEPVKSLKLQTQKINLNARSATHFASLVDELLITYKTCAIVVDGIGLYENLRISKDDVSRKGPNEFEPAYTLEELPIILSCQKWNFINTSEDSKILDAELLGIRCTTRFDNLKSNSINLQDHISTKSTTRKLALVGRSPFISCYQEAKDQSTQSYTKIISSLLPFWNKPQPTKFQINEVSKASSLSLHDHSRLATSIVASPDKRLAAVTDDFGRIMLIDVTNWLVIRIWKGYRNAQCGWIEVKRNPEEKNTPYASFLVIYAPKRGLLEVWSAQRGPRVAAFNVGKHCRLLYSGYNMLNMRAELAAIRGGGHHSNSSIVGCSSIEQSYGTNCYLLNAKSETVFLIELPYTYSLYKYGDLKSRDHLLIGELTTAIDQDSEISLICETLHRIILAESLEIAIHKIALDLTPDKIAPIMESLINKIMKNYDNQSGETMTNDDISIVELSKRIIRLCTIFKDLSSKLPQSYTLSVPDVNQRLIEHYDEHPKEVDEFAERLGWSAAEILRYLSLLTLEQSYRGPNRLPTIYGYAACGEPLSWLDFVSCFDLNRLISKTTKTLQQPPSDKVCIRLRELNGKFLTEDKVIKTALFLYMTLGEDYYKSSVKSSSINVNAQELGDCYNMIDPPSRLALLFIFWLSTKLCNHWKMWAFLQDQVGRISDELKITIMARDGDDRLLIESWKLIYQLILESDNIFAAIIATTVIKSDTLRMLSDNDKREKLAKEEEEREEKEALATKATANAENEDVDGERSLSAIDWECLCIDAERMSLLSQQLEDVLLLSLLLNYSHADKRIVDREFVYRVSRISVANIMRGGPSIVSELVAQWSAQINCNANIDLRIFTESYGGNNDEDQRHSREKVVIALDSKNATTSSPPPPAAGHLSKFKFLPRAIQAHSLGNNDSDTDDKEDHVKELLHHVKTSFPHCLNSDVILLHCLWEFCHRWTNSALQSNYKSLLLQRAIDALSLLSCSLLQHNAACLAFKTFFQRTFERLSLLIEMNPTILSPKCLRSRDTLSRRELNMNEDCLEDFVRFCCNLSEFLLQTTCRQDDNHCAQNEADGKAEQLVVLGTSSRFHGKDNKVELQQLHQQEQEQHHEEQQQMQLREQLKSKLLCQDDWWSTPTVSDRALLLNDNNNCGSITSGSSSLLLDDDRTSSFRIDTIPSDYNTAATEAAAQEEANRTTTMQYGYNSNNNNNNNGRATLIQATLSIEKLFSLNILLELNRLASLMDLIFKLKIIKSYPLTLIGEESRQALKLDLQQSPTTGAYIQLRSGSIMELREKFARRCIVNIVGKLTEETLPSFTLNTSDDESIEDIDSSSLSTSIANAARGSDSLFNRPRPQPKSATSLINSSSQVCGKHDANTTCTSSKLNNYNYETNAQKDEQREQQQQQHQQANNECMLLFANLLSLSSEWQLNCDELQLEFVFELFRCNHDKLAKQLIIRIQDKQMLATGLLKICSQRILVLFGLSPRGLSSNNQWRQRVDKWSLFQPNIASWLKSIQEEELHQELAELKFSSPGNELKPLAAAAAAKTLQLDYENNDKEAGGEIKNEDDEAFESYLENSLGLRMFVLKALQTRTKSLLELVTNYLDDQAGRLAYDLLQLLEMHLFKKQFLPLERKLWLANKRQHRQQRQQKGKKSSSTGVSTSKLKNDDQPDDK